jgi:hypothetical protein
MDKNGQLSLGDAPSIVLIIGLTFLMMATIAYIATSYGSSFPSDLTGTVSNETLTTVDGSGEYVANRGQCNFESFAVTLAKNATGGEAITSTNYSTTTDGKVYSTTNSKYNNTNWKIDYTFAYAGTACNVTTDLNTEIANNTSIAGIILTISLVGIVLAVLIGIFVVARNRGM